jgi:hypothetical protein
MNSFIASLGIALATQASTPSTLTEPHFLDWTGEFLGSAVTFEAELRLKNLSNVHFLVYGERTWGINLVWLRQFRESYTYNVNFRPTNIGVAEPSRDVVKFGLPIAIHIARGGYLKYEDRRVGVNLGWSTKPVYEWYLVGIAEQGSMLRPRMTLGLYNDRAKDFLIHHERTAGINLGWAKEKKSVSWNAEGRRLQSLLRQRGHVKMVAFLRQKLGW